MHIEINAGGIGAGVAVVEYQQNISGFIADAERVISSFKAVSGKVYDLNGGVGSLQGALDDICSRIQLEEEKKEAAIEVQKKSNDFLDFAIRVDKQVASLVNQNKDEFYRTNPWLKPAVNVDGIAWYGNVFDWLDETARKAWDGAVEVYDYLLDNYSNHGWVYDVCEGIKIAFTIAKAFVKIAGAFSTGAGIPIAILEVVSAGNDILNALLDAHLVANDNYDMVGKTNVLKDALINNAGTIGEMLGDKEWGEKAGELVYYGIDLVSFLDGADKLMKSFGKLNVDLYGKSGWSFVWGEVGFVDVMDNKFGGLSKLKLEKFLKSTLLGIDPASTVGLISDILDGIYETVDDGSDLAKEIVRILT